MSSQLPLVHVADWGWAHTLFFPKEAHTRGQYEAQHRAEKRVRFARSGWWRRKSRVFKVQMELQFVIKLCEMELLKL
jgi:hypothetical protein